MRIPCVGAIVFDAAGRLLVIQRGRPPAAGTWSLPGGRVERGETDHDALRREVAEETGLRVELERLVGTVERPGAAPDSVYEIRDYLCTVGGGTISAGDDAADVRWVHLDELLTLPCAPGLVETLRDWDCLPAPPG